MKFNTLFKEEESHEGRIANVHFKVGTDVFSRRTVTVPGHKIFWTAALSIDLADTEELTKMSHHLKRTRQLSEEHTHYLPPRLQEGKVLGTVLVSKGEVVDKVENSEVKVVVDPDPHSEGEKEHEIQAKVEEYDDGKKEKVLGVGDGASEVAKVDGDAQDGSTDSGKDERDISVEQIVGGDSRVHLAQAIKADQSLATARALADDLREGYYWN